MAINAEEELKHMLFGPKEDCPLQKSKLIHSEIPKQFLGPEATPVCVGVDEAGRGPVLGPMVYGIAYCPVDCQPKLRQSGVDDSKKLTAEQRTSIMTKKMRPIVGDWLGWSVDVLSPMDISECMLRRQKFNLNALSHSTVISMIRRLLGEGVNVAELYVDTVGPPEKYEEMLRAEFGSSIGKIVVAKKADSIYPIVGAASICAKVFRDLAVENWLFSEPCYSRLRQQYLTISDRQQEEEAAEETADDKSIIEKFQDLMDMGSGYPSDPGTKAWLLRYLHNVFGFPQLIRFSWSTCSTLLEDKAAAVRWPHLELEEEQLAEYKHSFKKQKVSPPKKPAASVKKEAAPKRGQLFKSMNLSTLVDL